MSVFDINLIRRGVRRPRICLGLVVTMLGTAGCTPSPDHAPFSVEYFRAHAKPRVDALARCGADPERLKAEAICKNALAAAQLEDVGSLRNLPPMGLPAKSPPHRSPGR